MRRAKIKKKSRTVITWQTLFSVRRYNCDAPQWAMLLDGGPCVKAVFMQYLLRSLWYSMWSIYLTFQPVTLVVTSPLNQAVFLSSISHLSLWTHILGWSSNWSRHLYMVENTCSWSFQPCVNDGQWHYNDWYYCLFSNSVSLQIFSLLQVVLLQ